MLTRSSGDTIHSKVWGSSVNFPDERITEALVECAVCLAAVLERLMKWEWEGVPEIVFVASSPIGSHPWGSLGNIGQVVSEGPSTSDILQFCA